MKHSPSQKLIPIKELIERLKQHLTNIGYKKQTIDFYQKRWNSLLEYFDDHNKQYFSEIIAMKIVDEKSNFYSNEKNGQLTNNNCYLLRTIRMIGDFQQHGTVLRRYHPNLSTINNSLNIVILTKFNNYCKREEYANSTQKGYFLSAKKLLSYLESNNIEIYDITITNLSNFLKTLLGCSYSLVRSVITGVKRFLYFLYKENILSIDLSINMPILRVRKQIRIPSIWNKNDLLKLIATIDRRNPAGKRDYAIILLTTRLGLRSVDVKRLTFSNFNWTENYIEFIQSKTKKRIRLPLLKDVGWAVIDYIKNGRPVSNCQEIFLRHRAPIRPFSEEDHLYHIITKYMRLAKISFSEKKKVGMHSLRHTLATSLLEQNIPLDKIADILGHQSVSSTPDYLKCSIKLLRECALSAEEDE
jgi:site-specific recombinase XerD